MKFKLNERVKVYGNFRQDGGHMVYLRGRIGTVVNTVFHENDETSEITVRVEGWGDAIVHPKQCRKLKAKKPLRTHWINVYPSYETGPFSNKEEADSCASVDAYDKRTECAVEFVEVRKKTS